jgi:predicted transcriptional regulator of viral defense system
MFKDYIDLIRSQGKRNFSFEQIIHDLKISIDSAKSGLKRLKKDKKVITPAKGLYVIVPPENHSQGCIPAEELVPILMKHYNAEYYTSLLSGAAFYGASHQKASKFQIISNRRISHLLEFGYINLEIIYKKSLVGLPLKDFKVSTGYLKVASPELVVFDLLNYIDKSGGLNHITTVLTELIDEIDGDKIIELSENVGGKSWLQRLGFLLDKIKPMNEEHCSKVAEKLSSHLENISLSYIPLASELPKVGFARNKKWKIIENTDIESDL